MKQIKVVFSVFVLVMLLVRTESRSIKKIKEKRDAAKGGTPIMIDDISGLTQETNPSVDSIVSGDIIGGFRQKRDKILIGDLDGIRKKRGSGIRRFNDELNEGKHIIITDTDAVRKKRGSGTRRFQGDPTENKEIITGDTDVMRKKRHSSGRDSVNWDRKKRSISDKHIVVEDIVIYRN